MTLRHRPDYWAESARRVETAERSVGFALRAYVDERDGSTGQRAADGLDLLYRSLAAAPNVMPPVVSAAMLYGDAESPKRMSGHAKKILTSDIYYLSRLAESLSPLELMRAWDSNTDRVASYVEWLRSVAQLLRRGRVAEDLRESLGVGAADPVAGYTVSGTPVFIVASSAQSTQPVLATSRDMWWDITLSEDAPALVDSLHVVAESLAAVTQPPRRHDLGADAATTLSPESKGWAGKSPSDIRLPEIEGEQWIREKSGEWHRDRKTRQRPSRLESDGSN